MTDHAHSLVHEVVDARPDCPSSTWYIRRVPSTDAPSETGSFLDRPEFSVLCEIEPPRRPALDHVHNQIAALKPVTDAFLIPDNHLGRATVSSIAVAREVADQGCASVACVNARDRNLLGFRRDLLTAAAYGVDHFLFVYGDAPKEGRRAEDLTVRGMMEEVRTFGTGSLFSGFSNFRIGTPVRCDRPLTWRARADFLVTQITPEVQPLIRWRESLDFDGQVYAGVLVLASSRMAARVNATIAGITVPQSVVEKLDGNPELGIDLALGQVEEIRDSGVFEGVHLVPVGRYREVAERLGAIKPSGPDV